MKLILEVEISDKDIKTLKPKPNAKKVMEELKKRMFATCEDWIIHGQEPEFVEVEK
jgi:hypothetical protein